MTKDLERLLATREIVVTVGSGGVGKTTAAAALGVLAATRLDARVLVLTIDPARRLAEALGLQAIGNAITPVPPEAFAAAGIEARGSLSVAMLDTKQSWDELVRRHAPDTRTRDRLLANSVYANISGRFVQSHDYIAAERLYDVHGTGDHDLVIVDTPPSRNALEFLDAPARMKELFQGRLVRWLTVPSRNRMLNVASKPFFEVADRILGSALLGDIVEFFSILQSMAPGFVQRADAVSDLLADRRSAFVVVSTLEAAPAREAEFLLDELARRRLHLGAIVLNKALPATLVAGSTGRTAQRLRRDATSLAAELGIEPTERVAAVLRRLAENTVNLQGAARLEDDVREELSRRCELVAEVPYLAADISDLAGLANLGAQLSRV